MVGNDDFALYSIFPQNSAIFYIVYTRFWLLIPQKRETAISCKLLYPVYHFTISNSLPSPYVTKRLNLDVTKDPCQQRTGVICSNNFIRKIFTNFAQFRCNEFSVVTHTHTHAYLSSGHRSISQRTDEQCSLPLYSVLLILTLLRPRCEKIGKSRC